MCEVNKFVSFATMSSHILLYLIYFIFSLTSVHCFQSFYNDSYYSIIIREISRNFMTKTEQGNYSLDDIILRMLDASTKFPTGIRAGNFFDLGNFDECYNIHDNNTFGKYCLGTIHLGNVSGNHIKIQSFSEYLKNLFRHPGIRIIGLGTNYAGFHFAVCINSSVYLKIPNVTFDFCYSKDKEPGLSLGAIFTVAILITFSVIIAISTIFDLFLYYTNEKSPHVLLTAFSFLSNGHKLFISRTKQDQILCLNGIRALSMMWVILGHEYFAVLYAPVSNLIDVQNWRTNPVNMFIQGATVSVDSFFIVGGFVTVYNYLKSIDNQTEFNILYYYLHRYLRLTPALGIMILIHTFLLEHFGNGPLWKIVDITLVQTCKDAWWSTLLYITNYVKHGSCLPQTWYLSVDMQLFLLSPIILISLTKWPRNALIALGVLSVLSVIISFTIGYVKNLGPMLEDPNFKDAYYIQTYTRFGPYVIGMMLGYFIYKIKHSEEKIKLEYFNVAVLWIVSLAGLVACVYSGYDLIVPNSTDRWGNSVFLALNRPAWAVALCGVIFLCVAEYGGPVDAFLSLPIFHFLTKISYSMYLVHFTVITVRYSSMRNEFAFSNLAMMHNFWGDFMFTLAISIILCLAFESPVIIIESYLCNKVSLIRSAWRTKA